MLHRVWIGPPDARSEEYDGNLSSFLAHNGDWIVNDWSDDDILIEWAREFKDLLNVVEVSDIVRLYALYWFGGMYVDHDVEVRCGVDQLRLREYALNAVCVHKNVPDNCVMYVGVQRHPVVARIIEVALHRAATMRGSKTPTRTGPYAMDYVMRERPGDFNLFGRDSVFYRGVTKSDSEDGYLIVHRSMNSWDNLSTSQIRHFDRMTQGSA